MAAKQVRSVNQIDRLWIGIGAVVIIVVMLVIWVAKSGANKELAGNISLDEFTVYLDHRIPRLMEDYAIPGVIIALLQEGEIKWSDGYGYADLENGRKMTTDTWCRVESISKSVTAWGVMKLVETGKIELDKPVEQYLKNWKIPESRFAAEKITVRQLLTHTAGMPLGDFLDRYSPEEEIPSLEESLWKSAVLMQEPGGSFSYSNTGYNLLELLIEEVTGLDFANYMKQEILLPLGMDKADFNWNNKFGSSVPVGYDLKGNPIPVYVYPEKAAGGLFAPVGDVATFVAAGRINSFSTGGQVLTADSIAQLYTPMVNKMGVYSLVFDSYGMGYYLETLSDGKKAVANGGQGAGIMTYFQFVPETGNGIVVLTNSQRSWPFFGDILTAWSWWNGFAPVGFGKIVLAQEALWLFIGFMMLVILGQIYRLGRGIISGRRRFAPHAREFRLLRLGQCSLFLISILGLLWSTNQDYLFISSVFPEASGWLGLAIFLLAVVLLLSAMFPPRKRYL